MNVGKDDNCDESNNFAGLPRQNDLLKHFWWSFKYSKLFSDNEKCMQEQENFFKKYPFKAVADELRTKLNATKKYTRKSKRFGRGSTQAKINAIWSKGKILQKSLSSKLESKFETVSNKELDLFLEA